MPGTGSYWSECETEAVLVRRPAVSTDALSVSVSEAPLVRLPMVQVPALYVVLPDGAEVTRVKPAGRASAIVTPVALSGPLLVAVTVKVTSLPTLGRL